MLRSCNPAQTGIKRRIYWGQQRKILEFPCYQRMSLKAGDYINGPALIIEPQTTTLVSPRFDATIDRAGNIILTAVKQRRNL